MRLEVQDVRRFGRALRIFSAGGTTDTTALLERDYLAHASPGLRAWVERYEVSSATIARAMHAHPSAYADPDGVADSILGQERALRAAFRKLQELYPQAQFPPVWFFVGHDEAGGLTRAEGVLVAVERLADRPRDVVPLVMHELAHFQSAMVQGVEVYRRIFGAEQTLLALALREGSADLIAELTTGRHTNSAAERYGLDHESELWSRFREEMHLREPGDWMFVQPSNPEWPPNLGYWMGYRIARSYYENAEDKDQAILDILNLTNFDAFLEASRYAEQMDR